MCKWCVFPALVVYKLWRQNMAEILEEKWNKKSAKATKHACVIKPASVTIAPAIFLIRARDLQLPKDTLSIFSLQPKKGAHASNQPWPRPRWKCPRPLTCPASGLFKGPSAELFGHLFCISHLYGASFVSLPAHCLHLPYLSRAHIVKNIESLFFREIHFERVCF